MESIVTLIVGVVAFSLVLAITLDIFVAFVILILFIFLAVSFISFSKGWLFLLGLTLLLPPVKIAQTELWVHNSFFVILGMLGISAISIGREKFSWSKTSINFLLFILIIGGFIIYGLVSPNKMASEELNILGFTLLIYFSLQVAVSHFFQTQKRIKRLFLLLLVVGVLHSLFGLASFYFNYQNSLGMGITPIKKQSMLLGEVSFEINGLLSDNYYSWLGSNSLAPLLLITIAINLGFLIISFQRRKQPNLFKEKEQEEREYLIKKGISYQKEINKKKNLDLISGQSRRMRIKKMIDLSDKKNWKRNRQGGLLERKIFLMLFLILQIAALALTFSHSALLVLVIGVAIMGTLFRSNFLLTFAAVLIVSLVVVFPGFQTSFSTDPKATLDGIKSTVLELKDQYFWGKGITVVSDYKEGVTSQRAFNSYSFVWENLGLIGLLAFFLLLLTYFRQVRLIYLKSDGWQRVWLIVIISVFFQMLFLGFTSNALLFGPAATIFWVLGGVITNLKQRHFFFQG